VLPIAFLAYALFRLLRRRGEWKASLLRYGAIAAGAAAASIPNLLFFLQRPGDFLGRGNYVLVSGGMDRVLNVLGTALMPCYYPGVYRSIEGPTHKCDGVSAALVAAGQNPVNPIMAAAAMDGYSHFSNVVAQMVYYGAAATPLGQKAAEMAAQGHRVLCIVSKDAGVASFPTHGQESRVGVAEFFNRPLDVSKLPPARTSARHAAGGRRPPVPSIHGAAPQETRTRQEERFSCYSLPGM